MRTRARGAVAFLVLALLTGCGGGSGSSQSSDSSSTLTSLEVTPATSSVAPGANQQFSATGKFSDGTTEDMTASVQWSSSDSNVASITGGGMAKALAAGTATVIANASGVKGTATLTVSSAAANLASISLSPVSPSIPVHTSQPFTATGNYKDGSSRDLTALVTWTSSTSGVATIDKTGLATGVAVGSAKISASLGGVSGSTTVTVSAPTITSIAITPDGLTLGIGISQQYTVTATYSDGSSQDLVSGVIWSSTSTAVATINNSGLATTVGAGSTTLTAQVGSLTDSTSLTVVAAHLVSIAVSPDNASIALGTSQQFTAVGSFDDGSTQLLTSVSWSPGSSSVATVDSTGLAISAGTSSTTISATSGSVTGTASLTVTAASIVSIAVTPSSSTMPISSTKQFTATGTFSDSTSQDVTASVLWSSSKPGVATINNKGLVTSVAAGTTTITAVLGSVKGSTGLTVSNVKLISISIVPSNPRIAVHTSVKLIAVGTFSDGSTSTNLPSIKWNTSSHKFALIRNTGVVYGKRSGTVTISASASGVPGSTTLTISNGSLVSIAITPANSSVPLGSPQQFTATGTFSDSTTQDITTNVHWSSSLASVATIANAPSKGGLATLNGTGTTTIGANSGGVTASTALTVQ